LEGETGIRPPDRRKKRVYSDKGRDEIDDPGASWKAADCSESRFDMRRFILFRPVKEKEPELEAIVKRGWKMRGRPRTRSPSWRRGKGEGRGGRFFCPACQPHEGKTQDLVIGDKGFICHKCTPKGYLLKLIEIAGDTTFPPAVA
jgi:hypothetical protein